MEPTNLEQCLNNLCFGREKRFDLRSNCFDEKINQINRRAFAFLQLPLAISMDVEEKKYLENEERRPRNDHLFLTWHFFEEQECL